MREAHLFSDSDRLGEFLALLPAGVSLKTDCAPGGPGGVCFSVPAPLSDKFESAVNAIGGTMEWGEVPAPRIYVACRAVNPWLYTIESTTPALRIYDIGAPESPSLIGVLALTATPTAIDVDRSWCYIAYTSRLDIINVDDPSAPVLFKTFNGAGDAATESWTNLKVIGGLAFLSGISDLSVVDVTAESDPASGQDAEEEDGDGGASSQVQLIDFMDLKLGGVSEVAVIGTYLFGADYAPTGAKSQLRRIELGGFTCNSIRTQALSSDEIQTESIVGRQAMFSGEVTARNLMVAGGGSNEAGILSVSTRIKLGTSSEQVHLFAGIAAPEGLIFAPEGSLYLHRSGAAGAVLFIKESGSGNTGWVAK